MSKNILVKLTVVMAFALAIIPAVNPAHAEDPIASTLDTSDYKSYEGLWKVILIIEALGNQEIELFLNFTDMDGKVGATLDSANQPEPLAISSIVADEEFDGGLNMSSVLKFGATLTFDITLRVRMESEGVLTGTIKDNGGLLTATVSGEPMSKEDLDAVQGRRPEPTETRMIVDGKRVRIAFADLEMGEEDWDSFQNVKDGEVFNFVTNRATKLYTDLDLKFGDTVIKKENMAPNYPGVYSLWLKRTGSSWSLVFNDQPDVWGSRHLAEHDVAEIPLTVTKTSGDPQKNFLVTLEPEGDTKADLTLAWGNIQMKAQCSLVQ